ncbi:conserved membrane hypothetical protein [Frankia canadensis]|uniref:Uncharacterized protein n=1 Tax=Frankia canadensis TaxID=1836972 RepID=A0A2I2KYC4_9ACTN|nr:conserved membrane hypothetical protein [Frankia canadensis]SOU57948.1 conserved membrane hypothetical protein [Frankia canadensis]
MLPRLRPGMGASRPRALPRLLTAVGGPGPAALPTTALRRAVAVMFAGLRACALIVNVALVLLWRGWYAGHPVALAAASATAAWSVIFIVVALRRGVGRALAGACVVVAVFLLAGVRWWLPPDLVGDPASWVLIASSHAMVVAAWCYSPRRYLAVVALTGGVAAGETALAGAPSPASAVIIVTISLLARYLLTQLRALAESVERELVAVAESRAVEIDLRRLLRARRDRELVIHNAVLNTLTGIAWGGGEDEELARRRCADGAAALRGLLGEQDTAVGAVPDGDAVISVERLRSLVAVEIAAGPADDGDGPAGTDGTDGTDGGDGPDTSGNTAAGADNGVEAAAGAGGRRLAYTAQLRRLTCRTAGLWLLLLAAPAARVWPYVRSAPLAVALFLLPLAAVALAGRRLRSAPLARGQVAAVVAVCAMIAMAGAWNAGGRGGQVMVWPMAAIAPLMMLVTVSCVAWCWAAPTILVTAIMIISTLAVAPGDPLALSHLLMALYYLWLMQSCLVVLRSLVSNTVEARTWAGRSGQELARRARLLDQARRRRRGLLDSVERDVVPLLAEVAAGRLDPRAQAVRTDCGRRAVAIRRLLYDDVAVHGAIGEVIDAAERRGTLVSSQILGGLDELPAPVRGEFVEQLHHALWAMTSRRVLLTVNADADAASLFLSCPWPGGRLPPAPAGRDIDMIVDVEDGQLCVELRWPTEPRPLRAASA